MERVTNACLTSRACAVSAVRSRCLCDGPVAALVGSAARRACSCWRRRCVKLPEAGAAGATSADPEKRLGYDVARDGLGPHDRRAQWRRGGRLQRPTGVRHVRLDSRHHRCGGVGAGELVVLDDIGPPPRGAGLAATGIPGRPTNGVGLDLGVAWYGNRDAAERLLTDTSGVATGFATRMPERQCCGGRDPGNGHSQAPGQPGPLLPLPRPDPRRGRDDLLSHEGSMQDHGLSSRQHRQHRQPSPTIASTTSLPTPTPSTRHA